MSTNFLKRTWENTASVRAASVYVCITCDNFYVLYLHGMRWNGAATKKITQIVKRDCARLRILVCKYKFSFFASILFTRRLLHFPLFFYSPSNQCDFIDKDTVIIAVVLSQILDFTSVWFTASAIRASTKDKCVSLEYTVELSDHQRNEMLY